MAKLAVLVLVATVTETEVLPAMDPLLAETDSHEEVLMRLHKIGLADKLVNMTACELGLNGPPAGP